MLASAISKKKKPEAAKAAESTKAAEATKAAKEAAEATKAAEEAERSKAPVLGALLSQTTCTFLQVQLARMFPRSVLALRTRSRLESSGRSWLATTGSLYPIALVDMQAFATRPLQ